MAYFIQGIRKPVVYCCNFHVGSKTTAKALLHMGAEHNGAHYETPNYIPDGSLVVQTIRHHCDVIMAAWFFEGCKESFAKFLAKVLNGNHEYLRADGFYGRYQTNYIVRYNTMQLDFDTLCINAGLPEVNLGINPRGRPSLMKWESMFNFHMRQMVYKRYGDEMERLGFQC